MGGSLRVHASTLLLELNLPTPHHHTSPSTIIITSSFARSATSPSFTYVSNLVPDSSLCRPAAPRLRPLQLLLSIASASAAAPRLRLLRLLLPDCMHPLAAPAGFQPMPAPGLNVLEHSSRSSRFSKLKHEGHASHVKILMY